jgi:hypothetical protein
LNTVTGEYIDPSPNYPKDINTANWRTETIFVMENRFTHEDALAMGKHAVSYVWWLKPPAKLIRSNSVTTTIEVDFNKILALKAFLMLTCFVCAM